MKKSHKLLKGAPDVKSPKKTVEEKIEMMKTYLLMKFNDADWHGVMDAAADIRELVVEQKMQPKYPIALDKHGRPYVDLRLKPLNLPRR